MVTSKVMIYPVGWRILRHGRDIFKIVKQVFCEVNLRIIEPLYTFAFIHMVPVVIMGAKVIDL